MSGQLAKVSMKGMQDIYLFGGGERGDVNELERTRQRVDPSGLGYRAASRAEAQNDLEHGEFGEELAQNGLEHDDAGAAGIRHCNNEQGEEEQSSERTPDKL